MKCNEFLEHLNQYIDKELDQNTMAQMSAHISDCPICQLEYENEKEFDQLLCAHIVKQEAPYILREKVMDQIGRKRKSMKILKWFYQPALVCLVLVMIIFQFVIKPSNAFPVFTESVASHMQFLKGAYPLEIRSSDIGEIKQWFAGKLDFAVNIPHINNPNVKLVGARLCHLKDKKVAFLIYTYNDYNISVFMIDSDHLVIPRSKRINRLHQTLFVKSDRGYQSVLCLDKRMSGVGCIFVSDLPQDQLMQLII
ncbi:MAG: zf-HC2 domain-containing protein [Candidatus Omnitrophica bacterium]|nr:zf-HC2 domain-containing protein [Candidatus Omnitrophota bacterium]